MIEEFLHSEPTSNGFQEAMYRPALALMRLFLFLLALLPGVVPGGNASAQQDLSLPGQFAYVLDGSRLFLVRGEVSDPLLFMQAPQQTRVSDPHFSKDGRYLAYCLQAQQAGTYPTIAILDTLTLETSSIEGRGSCSYDWSADGGTLLFAAPFFPEPAAGEENGLWTYEVETGTLERVLVTERPVTDPRWLPDGKTISFFDFCLDCVGRFYTYNLESGETREWSRDNSDDSIGPDVDWSPDGSWLAFDRAAWLSTPAGETQGLHLAGRDGQSRIEIHTRPGWAAYFPLWSPDGMRIAFASFESFTIGNYLNRRGDLMTVAPDGSDARTLYSSAFEVFPQAWSPDGRYLLFVEPLTAMHDPLPRQQLVLLEVETGRVLWDIDAFGTIAADWAPLPAGEEVQAAAPVAGKEGLLFVSSEYALAFYDPASDRVQKLTAPFAGTDLSVSPDGKIILFGDQILSLASHADGTVTTLPVESVHPRQFASLNWSPDSRKYGYVQQDGPAWVVDISGERTELPAGEAPPAWSFDGRWMAYCDRTGKLWVAEQGKPADWIIQRERCYVSWSPTQSILAYSTHPARSFETHADGTAFLYDPISGRTREVAQAVSSVGWSADGRLVSIRRILWMGASNFGFSISAVNPETGQELLIEEFTSGVYGNQEWIEQEQGYIAGRHRFEADLLAALPLAEILFDARRDGSWLLVGSVHQEALSIGCLETATNRLIPLIDVVHTDTPRAFLPGIQARFSPDGQRVLISDFSGGQTANWLTACREGEPVRLPGQVLPNDPYFSPNSEWLVMEDTRSPEALTPRIVLQDLAGGTARELQAGLNTHSTWFRMPDAPPPAPTAVEPGGPASSPSLTQQSGPIHLQSDEPGWSARSLVVPLLLWAGILIAALAVGFLLWRRSVLAKVGTLAMPEKRAGDEPASRPPAGEPPAEDVQAAFQEGVTRVRAGQAEEGIAELRKVVARTPSNEDAWFWLGIAAVKQKSYRSAERCFLQARKHGHPEADKALEWLRRQMH